MDRPALQKLVSGWYLCGDVHEKCSVRLGLPAASARCTVMTGGVCGNYGLLAPQVGTF